MRKWFAAKTVYRTKLQGDAAGPDADALAELVVSDRVPALDLDQGAAATLIEERVVLFLAETADEAIERAEKEAASYASGEAYNVYGQHVVSRALTYVETYELESEPDDGVEIFSRTFLSKRSLEDEQILDRIAPLDDAPSEMRTLFEPNVSQTARRIGTTRAGPDE